MVEEEAGHQPSTAAGHESQQETLTEEAKIGRWFRWIGRGSGLDRRPSPPEACTMRLVR